MSWSGLVALIEPDYPKAGGGRKPYLCEAMLRIHQLQNWFTERPGHGGGTVQDPLDASVCSTDAHDDHEIPGPAREHQLAAGILETINDYLRDKGLSLRQGTVVDAMIVHAPNSTKTKEGKRDPESIKARKVDSTSSV